MLVRTDDQITSRSLSNLADTVQSPTQRGIQFSSLDLQQAGSATFEVLSDRRLQNAGISLLDEASLNLIAANAAVASSELLGSRLGDVFLLSARDLIELALLSGVEASAALQSDATAMADSTLSDPGGNNLVTLQATTQLRFIGLGEGERAALTFALLTQAMRDSALSLNAGDDTVSIISGFRGNLGVIGLAAADPQALVADTGDSGLRFSRQDPAPQPEGGAWSFQLSATAIGLQDSRISTGAGNDRVSVSTEIDQELAADLGNLFADPNTRIILERIGMLRSRLDVGAGDDVVRIDGAVIDSTIDLGSGDNTLLLEGPVSGTSRILSGSGRNRIVIDGSLGGAVSGGSGDDRFDLNSLSLAGQLDGGDGNDSVSSGTTDLRELLLIQGRNQGFLGDLQVSSIEGLDLGGGDDVALMSLEGTLTGRLLGGNGLDRLEFSNWELPVAVDLDLGIATAIGGGIGGFEQVIGGIGSDRLAASGLFAGLDGNEGDDVLFLRWSPWLSGSDQGLELHGGGGRDLFVITGLESSIPAGWDGIFGIPTLTDLQIDLDPTGSGSGDRIGWLREQPSGSSPEFLSLIPSGLEGLGDARLLPIAPLEQLLSGMTDGTRQLAIALDASPGSLLGELRLLGSDGVGTSRLIAYVPGDVVSRQSGSIASSG